jgi:hypothetical protein
LVGAIERFEAEFLARRQRPPHPSMTITKAGVVLGAGSFLAPMRRDSAGREAFDLSGEDRILALLAAAFGRPGGGGALATLRRASELWARGEKTLAHIHLAQCRLPKLETDEQAFRLFLADRLMAAGYSPQELCKALGFDLPGGLSKYRRDQPRVPAGSGRASGQWGSAGGGGAGAQPPKPPAASSEANAVETGRSVSVGAVAAEGGVLGSLSAEALADLARIAAGFPAATAVAALGLIFIPSPNGGLTSQGAVPGAPGLNYSVNHDEGALRLTRTGPAGEEIVVAAHLGPGGLYRDAYGTPVARAVAGSVVVDPDAVRAAAAAKEKDDGATPVKAGAEARTETRREEPKLCPNPVSENTKDGNSFAVRYELYIRSIVNPQRKPPLPSTLTFSLTDPSNGRPVRFDDCREADGAMIEAKGHYAKLMSRQFGRNIVNRGWPKQAERQVKASGGRQIEWYFHEAAAADRARKLFEREQGLRRIRIYFRPHPDGALPPIRGPHD